MLAIHWRPTSGPWCRCGHQRSSTRAWARSMPLIGPSRSSRSPAYRPKRIGVEMAFLPMDAGKALSSAFADSEIKDALFVLERLRAVKSQVELAKLKKASELVTEAMLEVIAAHGPGITK